MITDTLYELLMHIMEHCIRHIIVHFRLNNARDGASTRTLIRVVREGASTIVRS